MFPVVLVASVWMGLFLEGDAGNLEGIEYLPDAMGSGLDVRYTCKSIQETATIHCHIDGYHWQWL